MKGGLAVLFANAQGQDGYPFVLIGGVYLIGTVGIGLVINMVHIVGKRGGHLG